MTDEPEVFEVLRKIRYDLTAAQAKVTDALKMLADMNLPTPDRVRPFKCGRCSFAFKTQDRLQEHLFNVHGVGELPPADLRDILPGVEGET